MGSRWMRNDVIIGILGGWERKRQSATTAVMWMCVGEGAVVD